MQNSAFSESAVEVVSYGYCQTNSMKLNKYSAHTCLSNGYSPHMHTDLDFRMTSSCIKDSKLRSSLGRLAVRQGMAGSSLIVL